MSYSEKFKLFFLNLDINKEITGIESAAMIRGRIMDQSGSGEKGGKGKGKGGPPGGGSEGNGRGGPGGSSGGKGRPGGPG